MTYGTTLAVSDNAEIQRDIFGGGNYGYALVSTNVFIGGNCSIGGNAFGGSNLKDGPDITINKKGGTITGGLYGGSNEKGTVSSVDMSLSGGTTNGGVYGGGYGTDQNSCDITGTVDITMTGGNVLYGLYGGGNVNSKIGGNATININGGTIGASATDSANVYGGGLGTATRMKGSVEVNIGAIDGSGNTSGNAVIHGDVYGGSAKGVTNCNDAGSAFATGTATVVRLNSGTIFGSLYGGGHGPGGETANVFGPVTVTVNGGSVKDPGTGNPASVFGCNNMAGSPKSTVDVTVNKTDATTTVAGVKQYAINGVYGGGNQAHYDYDNDNYPTVTVNGCQSSIKDVYGGGNAAAVPSTHVTINGGDIDRVFGGGNGESGTPAHVGYKNKTEYSTTSPYTANGNVSVTIAGGTINQVFGGSNSHGTIKGSIAVGVAKSGTCAINIGEVYGGGNEAPSNVGTVTIGCMDAGDIIDYVYGGSNNADITGNVNLLIKGGRINNVFGGNNTGHTISGSITVTVDWSQASCSNNYLGNVFGGGNLATFGTSENKKAPTVYINHGTVSHCVYGGGKGSTAVVTGNPIVRIGDGTASHCAVVVENVYGGGDAAAVDGNSSVTYNDNNGSSYVGKLFGGGNAANVTGTSTVNMTLGRVTDGIYGGCNDQGSVGAVTVNLTGGIVGDAGNTADVFGGGYGSATTTTGNITVNFNDATVYGDIYGGSALGSVNASTSNSTIVNIAGSALHGTVYGGGKGQNTPLAVVATSNGKAIVNINAYNANIEGIYGGANINGTVKGDIAVNINANVGASGEGNSVDIFGGGLGANTNTEGDVIVTVGNLNGTSQPVLYSDVYGGSALGNVNNAEADKTTINIYNGTVHGNIYGGGLGDKSTLGAGHSDIAAKVYGTVLVKIGGTDSEQSDADCHIDLSDCSVFGCNNTNGSPQGNVTVHVYRTGHNTTNEASYRVDDGTNGAPTYAIDQVFGGGNLADYRPENNLASSEKKASVYIHGCDNTIRRVFGGGNAAYATGIATTIDGGRFDDVFGGGNGESGTPADIGQGGTDGNSLTVHAGYINRLFGGSNERGSISGKMNVTVEKTGSCGEQIGEFFGGGNLAVLGSVGASVTLNTTVKCGTIFNAVYGGSNLADIYGDVTLTIEGGTIDEVYGGSKGSAGTAANIYGNVKLNIYGGTIGRSGVIGRAFGGSNVNGNITGTIGVDLDWSKSTCGGKHIDYIYGASNDASYTPTNATVVNPTVKLINGTVSENVYGGGRGSTATVTANPKVIVGDGTTSTNKTDVNGDVFGGGDAAAVIGNTNVIVTHNSCIGSSVKGGNVFGGGNAAAIQKNGSVGGNTEVLIENKAKVYGNVYGGGNQGTVAGDTKVIVNSK